MINHGTRIQLNRTKVQVCYPKGVTSAATFRLNKRLSQVTCREDTICALTPKVRYIALLVFLLTGFSLAAQDAVTQPFRLNKGQWDQRILYRAELPGGYMFLEENRFTYSFYDVELLHDLHAKAPPNGVFPESLRMHAYRVSFEGSNPSPITSHKKPSTDYSNYFIGNDPKKWASKVFAYGHVGYKELYDHINLSIYQSSGQLKYDFVVNPGGNPDDIQMVYEGVDEMRLVHGNLVIKTSLNEVIENQPYAYQVINGQTRRVKCKFRLRDNVLTFRFPNGYDENHPMIIDPVLIFGSYTGSTQNNFGFTATYDDAGNLYGGGIVFTGAGTYPTVPGSYSMALTGGTIDMGITKFNDVGTSLIYSTYLGGTQNESPHSMVVNSNDELIIFGSTGSNDFPMTGTSYDPVFEGGFNIPPMTGYGYDHAAGTDMILAKLSFDGSSLLGSTYVGGTDNDGLILADSLDYNYGDTFRGEVVVDGADNIYVASTTGSADFPLANPTQPLFGGGTRDACVFKFNPNLSTLLWSTFVGGSQEDAGYSVQLTSTGEVVMTGGTQSPNFPVPATGMNPGYMGNTDGYALRFNAAGNAITGGTFLGTFSHDQSYFVQLDVNDNVFVVGQSLGSYPVNTTLGIPLYENPNSHQFLHKMNPDMSTSIWSTVIGSGQAKIDLSICAFLVNQCDHIYISGWGGGTNLTPRGFFQPAASSVTGLPTTAGAFQTVPPNGSDFYLMVLDEDAEQLLYATFYGGATSQEHVDGGTSRFDKTGKVYQAVCAGCGGSSDFPSTPGAYSATNGSSCNLGVFKFDLAQLTSGINVTIPYICIPGDVTFLNTSNGGTDFYWDFGDGSPIYHTNSTGPLVHTYTDTGSIIVTLIVTDSLACSLSDTAYINLDAFAPQNASIIPVDTICPLDSVQLIGAGGVTYEWFPPTGLSDPNVYNPMASPGTTSNYMLLTTDSCGVDTAFVTVFVYDDSISAGPDQTICIGDDAFLEATGGVSYSWSPAGILNDPLSPTPIATPTNDTEFICEITTANGCLRYDTMTVFVNFDLPVPVISPDQTICQGDSVQLIAGGAVDYVWNPGAGLSHPNSDTTMAGPDQSVTYVVDFINGCGTVQDSVTVTVIVPNIVTSPDAYVCPGDTAQLWASGGVSYVWTPDETLATPDSSHTLANPAINTAYEVVMTDAFGCNDTAEVIVYIFPIPYLDAGPDQFIIWGAEAELFATGEGTFSWNMDTTLSCTDCQDPIATPITSTEYIVTLVDSNGCTNTDTVTVYVDGSLYVPNSFTPNGDGKNDIFYAIGEEIAEFEMFIFNRWGELIYESDDIFEGWDGKYKGIDSQIDTYVWMVKYIEVNGEEGEAIGHVTLVR